MCAIAIHASALKRAGIASQSENTRKDTSYCPIKETYNKQEHMHAVSSNTLRKMSSIVKKPERNIKNIYAIIAYMRTEKSYVVFIVEMNVVVVAI